MGRLAATFGIAALACVCACGGPYLARDGTVIFPEKGARGASVVTANGVEFHDRADVPQRITVRDPNEPWRPPIGFILPRSGYFRATSSPTVLVSQGLRIWLRPSDTRVPSWGGEVLVRVDVQAPDPEGARAESQRVAIVVDGDGEDTVALAEAALGQLSSRDRAAVIDARGVHLVVPPMPASHRSLALGAIARRLASPRGPADLARALARAGDAAEDGGSVVVLSDGTEGRAYTPEVRAALDALMRRRIRVSAFGSVGTASAAALSAITAIGGGPFDATPALEARVKAVRDEVPASGLPAFRDVVLSFAGTPAPSHVLEASGGEVTWRLDAGELALGDVRAGEARTEVVRVTVPAWVPGERFTFTVTAEADDVARGMRRAFTAELPCAYDDDIERIAESRHGDVIAYASALATLARLDAAFLGEPESAGLRTLARMHARSMARLARDMHDPAMEEQADLLDALLTSFASSDAR